MVVCLIAALCFLCRFDLLLVGGVVGELLRGGGSDIRIEQYLRYLYVGGLTPRKYS